MTTGLAFVSYSRQDKEFALKVANDLKAAKAMVWMDQLELIPGDRWDRAVQDALQKASIVVVILSPEAVSSDNVLDEVSFALDEKKTVVPVLYRDCTVPLRLRRLHYVDFRTRYGDQLQHLLTRLGAAAQDQVAVPTDETPTAEADDALKEFTPSLGPITAPFLMAIEDVFEISGRGTVVTGQIERGRIRVGEEVESVGFRPARKFVVTGIEMFRKLLDEGIVGDAVGVLLRGAEENEVERGQVISQPSSIRAHRTFRCTAYLLPTSQGGPAAALGDGHRLETYFRSIEVPAVLRLADQGDRFRPGTKASLSAELKTLMALEEGTKFALRQNGKTIGAGLVTSIID